MASKRGTSTSAFGVSKREGHDASDFYSRFTPPDLSDRDQVNTNDAIESSVCFTGSSIEMHQLADDSVALVVTSPPYFVGKEYELAVTGEDEGTRSVPTSYLDYLELLRDVFAECVRVLEPGGRIAVNVANLGRKPYRSLSADVIRILQDDLGLLLRGEVIWAKSKASSGSCAWGSFAKATNPVLRDNTERVIIASKGRFSRARTSGQRKSAGIPHASTLTNDEFIDVTRDIWEIDAESATRVGHPAPFPVDLPRRLIDLYTFVGDTVVDPFAGSGSTLVAAVRTGRIGVGYDLDHAYVELATARLADETARTERIQSAMVTDDQTGLTDHERRDLFYEKALEEGKKISDIAERVLGELGFKIESRKPSVRGIGLDYDFIVSSTDGEQVWYIDIAGSFTSAKSGLERSEGVWRVLGRLSALRSIEPDARVIVLTPNLPRKTSPSAKALRAVGPTELFDAVELFDPAGQTRLGAYASGESDTPIVGFWDSADLAE